MSVTPDQIKQARIDVLTAQKSSSSAQAEVTAKNDALNQLQLQKQIEDLGAQS